MIEKDIDLEKLKELFKLYKKDYSPIINEFTHNLVYKTDGKYVSFIIYSVIYENVEIIDVFTMKEYRNKNISTSLIKTLLNDYKNKNITLEVNKENENAIHLYEKLGFEKVAVRKGYYNGVDGYLMLKK